MPHPRSTRNEDGDDSGSKPGKFPKPFLLIIPALLAIGILLMFFVGKTGTHSKDMLYEDLESRIKRIEQRLSQMEQRPDEKEKEMHMRLTERLEKLEEAIARPNGSGHIPPVSRSVPAEKPAKPDFQVRSGQIEREKEVVSYEVSDGDTLFKISRVYGVSLDDLRRWNNLSPEEGIRKGQKLRVQEPDRR